MKILYVGTKDKKVNLTGGVHIVARNLFNSLKKINKITIDEFPRNSYGEIPNERYLSYHIYFLIKIIKIYIKYFTNQYDLIHFNQIYYFNKSRYLFNFKKYPYIQNIHAISEIENKYTLKLSKKDMDNIKKKIDGASKIVVNSKKNKELLKKIYKLDSNKITVIDNGVNRSASRKKIDLGNYFNVLFVGRISPEKGIDILMKILKSISKSRNRIKFHIIGTGPLFKKLKKYITDNNLNDKVKCYGHISNDEIIKYYNSADVYLMTSYSEGSPITILEAMRSNIPIIATNVGGIPEIIENKKTGILVNPNKDEIEKALLSLYDSKILRETIINNQKKKIEKYYWDNIAKKYIKTYKKTIFLKKRFKTS